MTESDYRLGQIERAMNDLRDGLARERKARRACLQEIYELLHEMQGEVDTLRRRMDRPGPEATPAGGAALEG